jgi:hypothetical protein
VFLALTIPAFRAQLGAAVKGCCDEVGIDRRTVSRVAAMRWQDVLARLSGRDVHVAYVPLSRGFIATVCRPGPRSPAANALDPPLSSVRPSLHVHRYAMPCQF